MSYW